MMMIALTLYSARRRELKGRKKRREARTLQVIGIQELTSHREYTATDFQSVK